MGNVLFTQAGKELYRVCKVQTIEGFFEKASEMWRSRAHLQYNKLSDTRSSTVPRQQQSQSTTLRGP